MRAAFFEGLGRAVWKTVTSNLRRRRRRYRKPLAALTVVVAIAVIYVATRDEE